MTRKLLHIVILLVLLSELSCKENVADRPIVNQTPRTFLWLYPDSTLGIGVSRQRIRWWGEDPDGVVAGYLFAFNVFPTPVTAIPNPDPLRYTWVVSNDTLILFPLDTLFRKFTVAVRAVDNSFRGLPNQSIVRMSPSPFWDRNDNGVFDSTDVLLPGLSTSADPAGAVQTFPIRNSPPTIAIANNPYDGSRVLKQPDTTFTVATFAFKGTDVDGDNTMTRYRIALNDTASPASWLSIPLRDTIVTLVVPRSRTDSLNAIDYADVYGGNFLENRLIGRVPGLKMDALNKFYVQVQDVAGEFSNLDSLPRGTDTWYVKRPRGKLLLVSDYLAPDADAALTTYLTTLAGVGTQFSTVDQINIAIGLTTSEKRDGTRLGSMVPPFVDPALVRTFLLYDYVLWYTEQFPSLGLAQLTVFPYQQRGGRVIFSTMFLNTIDARGAFKDFAPIDSVSSVDNLLVNWNQGDPPRLGDSRIRANYRMLPDSSNPNNVYPMLAFKDFPPFHSVFMRPIYRRSDASYIYHLQRDTVAPPQGPRYVGTPNLAVVDGQRRIIFFGIPLHLLDNRVYGNPQGLTGFFAKIFTQFNPNQRVDRRKF